VKTAAGSEKGGQKDLIDPDNENERFCQDLFERKINHPTFWR